MKSKNKLTANQKEDQQIKTETKESKNCKSNSYWIPQNCCILFNSYEILKKKTKKIVKNKSEMTMDTAGNSTVDPELREHLENLEVEVTLSSERLRQDMVRGFIWT